MSRRFCSKDIPWWKPPASPRRALKSIRCGRSRCPTTGSWARPSASRWTRRITSGSFIAPGSLEAGRTPRQRPIRRSRSAAPPAPPVLEFDQAGNLIGHWGGPGQGYDWPDSNHGITVDYKGNVWIGGNGRGRKRRGAANGSDDEPAGQLDESPGSPASQSLHRQHGAEVHAGRKIPDADRQARPAARAATMSRTCGCRPRCSSIPRPTKLYVADGYGNHRVIVFDADTGKYKRHWGAYGHKPDDADLGPLQSRTRRRPQQFRNPVHCAELVERQPALCLRPRERSHPGLQTGRDLRQGSVHQQGHAGLRLGVGHRLLEGPAAEVHLPGRRRERPRAYPRSRSRSSC